MQGLDIITRMLTEGRRGRIRVFSFLPPRILRRIHGKNPSVRDISKDSSGRIGSVVYAYYFLPHESSFVYFHKVEVRFLFDIEGKLQIFRTDELFQAFKLHIIHECVVVGILPYRSVLYLGQRPAASIL